MNGSGTKYHVAALFAAFFGLLCLPCILAPLLISAGLSSILLLVGTWFAPVLIALIGISIIGFFLSYRQHKNVLPLVLAVVAGGVIYVSRYVSYNQRLAYFAVAALLSAIALDWWIRKRGEDRVDCKIHPKVLPNERGVPR